MRMIIDFDDTLIDKWGSLVIHPVAMEIEKSAILLPGFEYRVHENSPTVRISTGPSPDTAPQARPENVEG